MENREEAEKNFYKIRGRSSGSVEEMERMLSKSMTNVIIRDGRSAMINLLSAKFLRPLLAISLFFVSMASANMKPPKEYTMADTQDNEQENSNLLITSKNLPPILVLCFSSVVITMMKRRNLLFASILVIFISQILATLGSYEIFLVAKWLSSFFGFTLLPLFWLMAAEVRIILF